MSEQKFRYLQSNSRVKRSVLISLLASNWIVCLVKYTVVYNYFSLPRARERLCHARQYRDLPEAQKLSRLQKAHRSASSITSFGSQVGDTRPLSSCNFSPNSGIVQ